MNHQTMHDFMVLAEPGVTVLLTDVSKPFVFDWMKLMPPSSIDRKIFSLKQNNFNQSKDQTYKE